MKIYKDDHIGLDGVLAAFGGAKVRRGDNYRCNCPAHNDTHASLAVMKTEEGILVQCLAGCITADVFARAGLTLRDGAVLRV